MMKSWRKPYIEIQLRCYARAGSIGSHSIDTDETVIHLEMSVQETLSKPMHGETAGQTNLRASSVVLADGILSLGSAAEDLVSAFVNGVDSVVAAAMNENFANVSGYDQMSIVLRAY